MSTLVAVVDDHRLLREVLATLIRKFDQYDVLLTAENGHDLLHQLARSNQVPDIALVDLNMPVMDGIETAARLQQLYPTVRVLSLLMVEQEEPIRLLIQNGVRGYLLKDVQSEEFRRAMDDVMTKGYYIPDFPATKIIRNLNISEVKKPIYSFKLTEREYEFLKLACSELTYIEIAAKMGVSLSTVEEYQEALFQKMNVRTRIGMIIEAVRHGLIDP